MVEPQASDKVGHIDCPFLTLLRAIQELFQLLKRTCPALSHAFRTFPEGFVFCVIRFVGFRGDGDFGPAAYRLESNG